MEKRLIWDWNGTLLDDVSAAVNALNRMLVSRDAAPITVEHYRRRFGFPVRPFYAELGVDLDKWDWDDICKDFHAFVAAEPQDVRGDAFAALSLARDLGFRQCVLSALRQDLLDGALERNGLRGFFDLVYGVDNLDGASKLERGREGGFDFAVCDLVEIARECVGRFAGRAGAAGIVLELHAGSGAVCIDCDAAQISRALDNLIANAIFHSSSDRITVTVSESGPFAVAAVEDHGVGIPPGHRERVFERFHRVDPSRSDSTGGSGLGLSIVRGIARLHGGEVRLEEAKPAGCRFSLLLPRCRRPPNIGIISSHIQGAR
jgi:signal transduction histidine kinase